MTIDSFGRKGVRVEFDRENCKKIKKTLAEARKLYKERHFGNNLTMQREKYIIIAFISLASEIVEDKKEAK